MSSSIWMWLKWIEIVLQVFSSPDDPNAFIFNQINITIHQNYAMVKVHYVGRKFMFCTVFVTQLVTIVDVH
jgi:hypothetical protein